MQKTLVSIFFAAMAASAGWCIYRDTRIEKQYTGDLRNRIVGARLQQDGRPPYFYKWKTGDEIRYYDPQNFDTLRVSNITATPFFHQLLYPLAGLNQRTVSRIWLGIEYLLFLAIVLMSLSLATEREQRYAVFAMAALFLFTNAWTGHIAAGQLYLTIPFLAMSCYCLLNKKNSVWPIALAGAAAAVLLLIRPNTILFFLPLGWSLWKLPVKYKTAFMIPFVIVAGLAIGSAQAISYWNDYRAALTEQVKSHQQLHPAIAINDPDPRFRNWEGWDLDQVSRDAAAFPYHYNMEHGNVFVLFNHAFHTHIPVSLLIAAMVLAMMTLLFLFYRTYGRGGSADSYSLAVLGFCLYMVSDLFSPIHRFQYNGVQWLFPLLLAASRFHLRYQWPYLAIITGLVLNSVNLQFMVMEQTLGEYIIFGALLYILLTPIQKVRS